METLFDGLAPGAYTIDVAGAGPASPFAPVTSDILIWETPESLGRWPMANSDGPKSLRPIACQWPEDAQNWPIWPLADS